MLPILDMWTDVIAAPGSRTSGTQAANFAIVGQKWQGDLPDDMGHGRQRAILSRREKTKCLTFKRRKNENLSNVPLRRVGKSRATETTRTPVGADAR